MGLSNFPGASEGVLPVLVMNTVLSVALLKNVVRSVYQIMSGANVVASESIEEDPDGSTYMEVARESRRRQVSVARYKSLCQHKKSSKRGMVECCVCLCGFEAEQEVSELSCKHFFHKGCLDKWFNNDHSTCPLCRSVC